MLLGGPQNTIKSHLVFTALFCFAPFSVFFSRMSAPYLITEVKQRWARLVLGGVTTQMTSMPGAVRRCTRILRPGKASEKTPRGVISTVCVKICNTPQEKKEKKGE
jgi:hypothetical protein